MTLVKNKFESPKSKYVKSVRLESGRALYYGLYIANSGKADCKFCGEREALSETYEIKRLPPWKGLGTYHVLTQRITMTCKEKKKQLESETSCRTNRNKTRSKTGLCFIALPF